MPAFVHCALRVHGIYKIKTTPVQRNLPFFFFYFKIYLFILCLIKL